MFSYLWIVTGTLAYGLVTTGLVLRLRAGGQPVLPVLVLAALGYVPFVGFPFFTAAVHGDDDDRTAAVFRVESIKKALLITDSTTGNPKDDRYLNTDELNRLMIGIADTLTPPARPPAPKDRASYLCDYLYLYAWFHQRSELTLNQKWNAAMYMPREFYRAAGGSPLDAMINYDLMAQEVAKAWQTLRAAAASPPNLALCPGP